MSEATPNPTIDGGYCRGGLRCEICGTEYAGRLGTTTLYFDLPANAGLPGRGVLVEWGEGRVSAGLDAGPFVNLPLGEFDGADEVIALKARVAELESIRAEQAEKLHRHIEELDVARGCYKSAMESMASLYENAAAILPAGALPDAEYLGPEIGVEAAELARAIAELVADLSAQHARVAELEARPNSLTVARRMAAAEGKTLSGAGVVLAVLAGATTIESPPPEDLLDRITPGSLCRHTRRSLRPDPHGNPVTTCIDCGDETP